MSAEDRYEVGKWLSQATLLGTSSDLTGGPAIAAALCSNVSIRRLNLSWNSLRQQSAAHLGGTRWYWIWKYVCSARRLCYCAFEGRLCHCMFPCIVSLHLRQPSYRSSLLICYTEPCDIIPHHIIRYHPYSGTLTYSPQGSKISFLLIFLSPCLSLILYLFSPFPSRTCDISNPIPHRT